MVALNLSALVLVLDFLKELGLEAKSFTLALRDLGDAGPRFLLDLLLLLGEELCQLRFIKGLQGLP